MARKSWDCRQIPSMVPYKMVKSYPSKSYWPSSLNFEKNYFCYLPIAFCLVNSVRSKVSMSWFRYMHITQMDSGTGLRAGLQIFPIRVILTGSAKCVNRARKFDLAIQWKLYLLWTERVNLIRRSHQNYPNRKDL